MANGPKMMLAFALAALLAAPSAEAAARKKKTGTKSPHHCMKAGAEVAGLHKRECRAGGGKWLKVRLAAATAR